MTENKIVINNLKLNFREHGNSSSKTKLLILHGWNQFGSSSWEDLISNFDIEKVWIVAPDMPGFGKSQEPFEIWGVTEYSEFVTKFIKTLEGELKIKNKKWVIVGHSFGGAVAAHLAAIYPETFSKLILLAPAIIRGEETKKLGLIKKVTKFSKKILSFWLLKKLFKVSKKVWYKIIGSPDYSKTSKQMALIMQKVLRQDQQSVLSKINLETLIIWGREDKYTPFWQARVINSGIKNSQLVVFEGINHGLHLNATANTAAEIKKFIG